MPQDLAQRLARLPDCDRALLAVIRAAMIELSKDGNKWLEDYVYDAIDERLALAPGAA